MSGASRDVLFVGATRPPMIMGVTFEVFLLSGMLSGVIFLAVGNPLYLLAFLPMYFLGYLVCLTEPRKFALFAQKLKCTADNRNRLFWKCNSYSPFEGEE